jgi:FkbH-like protein
MATFLGGLDMRAVLAPFDEMHLPRIVQLINKTNQWNLTTRRHTEPQVRAMMADENCHTAYVKLRDRFGDSGLIAVWIAFRQDDEPALRIDTWLMSCRVIGRGVERLLLQHAVDVARAHGLQRIIGEYLPTPKNVLVKDLYASLGFAQSDAQPDGSSTWSLAISQATRLPEPFIQLESAAEETRA